VLFFISIEGDVIHRVPPEFPIESMYVQFEIVELVEEDIHAVPPLDVEILFLNEQFFISMTCDDIQRVPPLNPLESMNSQFEIDELVEEDIYAVPPSDVDELFLNELFFISTTCDDEIHRVPPADPLESKNSQFEIDELVEEDIYAVPPLFVDELFLKLLLFSSTNGDIMLSVPPIHPKEFMKLDSDTIESRFAETYAVPPLFEDLLFKKELFLIIVLGVVICKVPPVDPTESLNSQFSIDELADELTNKEPPSLEAILSWNEQFVIIEQMEEQYIDPPCPPLLEKMY